MAQGSPTIPYSAQRHGEIAARARMLTALTPLPNGYTAV